MKHNTSINRRYKFQLMAILVCYFKLTNIIIFLKCTYIRNRTRARNSITPIRENTYYLVKADLNLNKGNQQNYIIT